MSQVTVNFYKLLEKDTLINSIYLICGKIMEAEEKVIIYLESEKEMQELDDRLWTFNQSEFMPHLASNSPEFEEFKEETSILLTVNKTNEIDSQNLIILKPLSDISIFKSFNKVFFLFSSEEEDLLRARAFWKEVYSVKSDFACKFYEQNRDKKWELKA